MNRSSDFISMASVLVSTSPPAASSAVESLASAGAARTAATSAAASTERFMTGPPEVALVSREAPVLWNAGRDGRRACHRRNDPVGETYRRLPLRTPLGVPPRLGPPRPGSLPGSPRRRTPRRGRGAFLSGGAASLSISNNRPPVTGVASRSLTRTAMPVGAGVDQPHEQAEAGDAGDPAVELGPDLVGQEGGDIAVGGVALGGHGPALGMGDALGGILDLADVLIGQAIAAQPQ